MEHDSQNLQQLIDSIPVFRQKQVHVSELNGGLSNSNYLVTPAGSRDMFVLRVAGDRGSQHKYSRIHLMDRQAEEQRTRVCFSVSFIFQLNFPGSI